MLKTHLSDLQDWKAEAVRLGLREAEAGQLRDIGEARQRWEDKRAGEPHPQR